MKLREKHIERLSKGKKSGIHLGSRSVPHHLHQYEQKKFDLAVKYRFLTIKENQRPNLSNLWEKYCQAKAWKFIVLRKNTDGTAVVTINESHHQYDDPKDAKAFIMTQL